MTIIAVMIIPMIFSVLFLIAIGIRIKHKFCKSHKEPRKYLVGLSYQLSTNFSIAKLAMAEIKATQIKTISKVSEDLEFVLSFEGV